MGQQFMAQVGMGRGGSIVHSSGGRSDGSTVHGPRCGQTFVLRTWSVNSGQAIVLPLKAFLTTERTLFIDIFTSDVNAIQLWYLQVLTCIRAHSNNYSVCTYKYCNTCTHKYP